jgi:hypothetical protein
LALGGEGENLKNLFVILEEKIDKIKNEEELKTDNKSGVLPVCLSSKYRDILLIDYSFLLDCISDLAFELYPEKYWHEDIINDFRIGSDNFVQKCNLIVYSFFYHNVIIASKNSRLPYYLTIFQNDVTKEYFYLNGLNFSISKLKNALLDRLENKPVIDLDNIAKPVVGENKQVGFGKSDYHMFLTKLNRRNEKMHCFSV